MNLYEFAKNELDLLEKDCKTSTETNMQKAINNNILEVVKLFASQQHSGASANYAINILIRLLSAACKEAYMVVFHRHGSRSSQIKIAIVALGRQTPCSLCRK